MKYTTILKIAKKEGFEIAYIENGGLGLRIPGYFTIYCTKSMTLHRLQAAMQQTISDIFEAEAYNQMQKMRLRRAAMRRRVIDGGRWHNLPRQGRAVLTVVVDNTKEVA